MGGSRNSACSLIRLSESTRRERPNQRQRRRPIQRQRPSPRPRRNQPPKPNTATTQTHPPKKRQQPHSRLHAQTSGRQLERRQIKAGAEEFLAARSSKSARFGEDRTRAMSRASAEPPHASKKRRESRGPSAHGPFGPSGEDSHQPNQRKRAARDRGGGGGGGSDRDRGSGSDRDRDTEAHRNKASAQPPTNPGIPSNPRSPSTNNTTSLSSRAPITSLPTPAPKRAGPQKP